MVKVYEYKQLHKALGCAGCLYADSEQVNKGPCCTRNPPVPIESYSKCKARKE